MPMMMLYYLQLKMVFILVSNWDINETKDKSSSGVNMPVGLHIFSEGQCEVCPQESTLPVAGTLRIRKWKKSHFVFRYFWMPEWKQRDLALLYPWTKPQLADKCPSAFLPSRMWTMKDQVEWRLPADLLFNWDSWPSSHGLQGQVPSAKKQQMKCFSLKDVGEIMDDDFYRLKVMSPRVFPISTEKKKKKRVSFVHCQTLGCLCQTNCVLILKTCETQCVFLRCSSPVFYIEQSQLLQNNFKKPLRFQVRTEFFSMRSFRKETGFLLLQWTLHCHFVSDLFPGVGAKYRIRMRFDREDVHSRKVALESGPSGK